MIHPLFKPLVDKAEVHCTLSLPLPTSLNSLYTQQYIRGRFTGKKILSREGVANREDIMLNVERQITHEDNINWDVEYTRDNHVFMYIVAYVSRSNVDLDNLLKTLNDSIEESGLVFLNDKRVVPRFLRVYVDAEAPRVELLFTQTGWEGTFETKAAKEEFESNCKSCSRYRNGSCGILKKVKENRIIEEVAIDDNFNHTCLVYKQKK